MLPCREWGSLEKSVDFFHFKERKHVLLLCDFFCLGLKVFFFPFFGAPQITSRDPGKRKNCRRSLLEEVEGDCGLRAQDLFSLCSFLFSYMNGTHYF